MRFQPGEPNSLVKSVYQCEWDSKQVLAYCSGNNLIIFQDGTLLQTVYLPSDGLAIDIQRGSGEICVTLTDSVWILTPKNSYSKGLCWEHTQTIEEQGVQDCRWIDTQLLLAGRGYELRTTNGQILWSTKAGEVTQCVVSHDSLHFVSHVSGMLQLWSRVSPSAANFDFIFLRHPSEILWTRWIGPVLFTWSRDSVLRAFKPLRSGRFELCGNMSLAEGKIPALFGDIQNKLIYIVCIQETSASVIQFDYHTDLVSIDYLTKDIPIKVINDRKAFDLSDMITVYGSFSPQELTFTLHKRGSLLVASTPNFIHSRPKQLEIAFSGIYTGHLKSIKRICRSSLGFSLFTQTRFQENIVWEAYKLPNGETTLGKRTTVNVNNPKLADLWNFSLVTVTDDNQLVLWDTTSAVARQVTSIQLDQGPLLICCLRYEGELYAIAVFEHTIKIWRKENDNFAALPDSDLGITIAKAVMVDPVGWTETSRRDVLTTIADGKVQTWTLNIAQNKVEWTETSQFDIKSHISADVADLKVQMSSRKKLVVAQRSRILIWDAVNDVIEFDKVTEDETVNDLDWTTTPTGECLLGVGYSSRVIIYCQQRYDYTKQLEAWVPIRELEIGKYTSHEIGDSVWLKDGTFVIGAGNQLFIQDANVERVDEKARALLKERNTIFSLDQTSTLFDINAALNGPLPVYHPQFLIQLIFSDRIEVACKILCRLLEALKYAEVSEPQMIAMLDYWLDLRPENMELKEENKFDTNVAAQLEEQLQKKALSYLTRHHQVTLLSVVQSLAKIQNTLDSGGTKFMLGYQLFRLHSHTQEKMNMRDFVWASLSSSKQVLLDEVEAVGATSKQKMFENCGLMFWLEDNMLREQTEQLAKKVFALSRDPTQVSLLYIALRKKQLLLGLWRITSSHPEQAKTLKLLSNDFETPRWKSAALKNAYALMSRHRYEYAAALFLLGGSCKDACNVLARQLKNLPLAFLVARLYDGDSGDAMHYLIERFLEDEDEEAGDDIYSQKHWMRVWAYMTVGDIKSATKAATTIRGSQAKRSITDPVLLWVYKHLRQKFTLTAKEEIRVLRRTSTIYCRMGCDLIALAMCREWPFVHESTITPAISTLPSRAASVAPSDTPIADQSRNSTPTPSAPLNIPEPPAAAQFDLSAFGF